MLGLLFYLRARGRRRAINEWSFVSHPAGLQMSDAKLRRLSPSLYLSSGPVGFLRCLLWDGLGRRHYIRDMLLTGDSRAAVVVSVSPLLVACYCDDLDGVCVLRFHDDLAEEHGLRPGHGLLTVLNNAWSQNQPDQPVETAQDLVQGNAADPGCVNFWPLVAEFLAGNPGAVAARKAEIDAEEYAHCQTLGEEHLRRFGGAARDGSPDHSMQPAVGLYNDPTGRGETFAALQTLGVNVRLAESWRAAENYTSVGGWGRLGRALRQLWFNSTPWGLIEIQEGPIRRVNVGWLRGADDLLYFAEYGVPVPGMPREFPHVRLKLIGHKTIPLFGQVERVEWRGKDFGLGIADRLNNDSSVADSVMAAVDSGIDLEINAVPAQGFWILTEKTLEPSRPSRQLWECYQLIARRLLATTMPAGE